MPKPPAVLPFPIRQIPTWAVINIDDPVSLPLMGQFNTEITWVGGKPIWAERPAIAGGEQWLQYVGHGVSGLQFTFHAIANDVLDAYPQVAWDRLVELAQRDESLGRPPMVMFVHGLTVVQGYITSYGDPAFKYWQHDNQITNRVVREVGPVPVTIKIVPGDVREISLGTTYILHTGDDTVYEELARDKYGDARYGASLREYNQGASEGDQIELPRRGNPAVKKYVSTCAYFDPTDVIDGL